MPCPEPVCHVDENAGQNQMDNNSGDCLLTPGDEREEDQGSQHHLELIEDPTSFFGVCVCVTREIERHCIVSRDLGERPASGLESQGVFGSQVQQICSRGEQS